MFKIVIADDEVHIRELISRCINESGIPVKVVGAAENGEDAFELIEEHQPEILITDVCMPGTGGLELIERIRRDVRSHELKIIIISGYDEFLYVQKALKLGVSDYLLKPFSPEELLRNLEEICRELEQKRRIVQNLPTLTVHFENQSTLGQERILKQLMSGEGDWERLKEEADGLGMELCYTHYVAGLIKFSSEKAGGILDTRVQMALEEIVLSVKERYFHESIQSYGMRLEDNAVLILFCSNARNKDRVIRCIEDGAARLNDSLKRYYHAVLNCALGLCRTEIKDIRYSCDEARFVMRTNLWENRFVVTYAEERTSHGGNQPEDGGKMGEELLLQIKLANSEGAMGIFQTILQSHTGADVRNLERLDLFLLELLFKLENLLRSAGATDELLEKLRLHECVRRQLFYGDIREIKSFMEDLITKACHSFQTVNQNKGEKIVGQMKLLIEHNLAKEEFDLETIASQLFFSSNYLRRIFKQLEGESFSDYLIGRRMESARERLRDRTKKIIEISEECGYSNQRYFASAFKKYYGYTPTEYRESMEGK